MQCEDELPPGHVRMRQDNTLTLTLRKLQWRDMTWKIDLIKSQKMQNNAGPFWNVTINHHVMNASQMNDHMQYKTQICKQCKSDSWVSSDLITVWASKMNSLWQIEIKNVKNCINSTFFLVLRQVQTISANHNQSGALSILELQTETDHISLKAWYRAKSGFNYITQPNIF